MKMREVMDNADKTPSEVSFSKAVSLFEQIRKTYFFDNLLGFFGGTQTALNFFCFLLRFCHLCSSPKK